jgi:hypothetical protein
MRRLKVELEKGRSAPLSFETLARFSGSSPSTAFDRLHREHQPQVEALLSLVERLPEQVRFNVISEVCRCHPDVQHRRIAFDPTQSTSLKLALKQPTGLTVVQGANPGARTFVVTALANEAGLKKRIAGFDVHYPDWFVEADGVRYWDGLIGADRMESWVRAHLDEASESQVVIWNGIWSLCPDLQATIVGLAVDRHVIVADELQFGLQQLTRMASPAQIVDVTQEPDDRIRLLVRQA